VIRFHLLGSKPKGSFVTGSTANSSDNATSITLLQKAYRDTLGSGILLNLSLFLVILGAMGFAIQTTMEASRPVIPTLFTTIAWPPFLHLFFMAVTNNWVPVAHIFSPPAYHVRDSRLIATEKGVSYPSADIMGELTCETSLLGLCCSFLVPIILVGVLVGAFISA
jgi:membrane-associated phospholipid phosphatase